MPPRRLDAAAPGFEQEFAAFLARNRDSDENVDRVAAAIVADVRTRGDAALLEYTRKLDRVDCDRAVRADGRVHGVDGDLGVRGCTEQCRRHI